LCVAEEGKVQAIKVIFITAGVNSKRNSFGSKIITARFYLHSLT
jgi:hypothetical protein